MKIIFAFGLVFLAALSCCQNKSDQLSNGKVSQLDDLKFEILATQHFPTTQNFHILLKDYSKDSLQWFVDTFRSEYCTMQCNIHLYDDPSIKSLITKYPLTDSEYLQFADHFVASSMFEMPEIDVYPFQDIKYKELGGKNWKKID